MNYIVYGRPGCNYCVRANNLLRNSGHKHLYCNILTHPSAYQFIVDHEGHETVPQIYTRDALGIMTHIGGFEDLMEHLTAPE